MAQQTDHIGDTNKMVTMKLYTEEQVREAFNMGSWNKYEFEYVIKSLTPIELPSDEKKVNKFNAFISTEVALKFLTKEQGERLKWYYETYLNS